MKDINTEGNAGKGFWVTYSPLPEYVRCPNCGFTIGFEEYWRSETYRCIFCGSTYNSEGTAVH